jgi:hypothetical protein
MRRSTGSSARTTRPGEILAILGPKGAGKTTTVESIGGLRTPDLGTIRVLGLDPRHGRDELRRVVGIQLRRLRGAAPRDSVESVIQGRVRGLRSSRGGRAAVPKLNVAGSNPVSRSIFPILNSGPPSNSGVSVSRWRSCGVWAGRRHQSATTGA